MKKNMTNTRPTASTPTQSNLSLFSSIIANEDIMYNEYLANKSASRVGLVYKVLLNRKLDVIKASFEDKLNTLIADTCNAIDNELRETKADD